ncbi:MAG TPA: methyltransferase domain-containing protein [Haliangiales bacterium]|nr:methyltransferase domain-containing protein [Haliangiales bacterium]
MDENLNPQGQQMADESMVRNLAAQAEAIWPQELSLFRRYRLPDDVRVLDAGCGTGEATLRLAELYPRSKLLGVDIIDAHLALAADRCARFGDRVRFENRSIYGLDLPGGTFDLTVCRHVIHSIPHPEQVLAELVRVTRPGGRLHLIAEDYGMIHFPPRQLDADAFWRVAPRDFGRATGTDLFVGRRAYSILRRLGVTDLTVDYIVVDTLRAARETFAGIFGAWRDGYVDAIAEHTPISRADAVAHFDDMIATVRDEDGYGVWLVPVIAGVVS